MLKHHIQLLIAGVIIFSGTVASAIVFSSYYGIGPWGWLALPIMMFTFVVLMSIAYAWFYKIDLSRRRREFDLIASKAGEHQPNQSILEPVKWLLSLLESMDSTSAANHVAGLFETIPKTRDAIKDKIKQFGPAALPTLLKYSRHEGEIYREDVFGLFESLVGDPIQFFIDHLEDEDAEIRWSCQKWIRDKGEGDTRPVEPLIRFYASRGNYEGRYVNEALHGIGPIAAKSVAEMVLNEELPLEVRIAAAEKYEFDIIEDDQAAKLKIIVEAASTPLAFKEAIECMFEKIERWRALKERARQNKSGGPEFD